MDITQLTKYIRELEDEREQRKDFRKNYIELSEELRGISVRLSEISKKIDPISGGSSRKTRDPKTKSIKQELYELMKNGTHVTRDLIISTYGVECNGGNILSQLKKLPHVKTTKDKGRVRLYI